MESIDIVIPWVDDTDPVWKEDRRKFLTSYNEGETNLDHYFRDWDTLRYVFRGIEKFMPWVRNIHFVTCGHLPEWLNVLHPKLRIHKHKDFFNKESSLPVFSCNPIEMNLENIPGLAEKFIYFNDDTLVVKQVKPERFFQQGIPVDHLVFDFPRGGWLYEKIRIKDTYASICKNSINLLRRDFPIKKLLRKNHRLVFDKSYLFSDKVRNFLFTTFGMFKWIKVNHHPQGFLKSNLNKCYRLYKREMDATCKNRFRSENDLNQYLYRNYALLTGQFVPHYFDDSFCIVLSSIKNYVKERAELFSKSFVCINDSSFLPNKDYPKLKEMVDADLKSLFPEKSQFEL